MGKGEMIYLIRGFLVCRNMKLKASYRITI